jgi:uncharacterized membrane protein
MRRLLSLLLVAVAFAAGAVHAANPSDALVSVIGVRPNDVLNLRAQPGPRSAVVATLPPDATGIAVVGQATQSLDWVMIQKGRARGWANARFLAYGDPQQQDRLPVRLRCAGTEPFWGIEVGYGRADAEPAFEDRRARLPLASPVPAAARPRIWLLPSTSQTDATAFLLVERRTCSDGMSEASYPFTVVARVGGSLLSGCCR